MERTPRARVDYFGSADAKDVVPLAPWGCRRSFVYRKLDIAPDDPEAHAARFESREGPVTRGRKLEDLMRQEVRERLQHPESCVEYADDMEPLGPLHREDWLAAHPDGIVRLLDSDVAARFLALVGSRDEAALAAVSKHAVGDLELKTCGFQDFFRVRKSGPRDYDVLQCMHHMAANGAAWTLLVYLNAEHWRWAFFLVLRDEAWERDSYLPATAELWKIVQDAKAQYDPAASPDTWEKALPDRLPEGSDACSSCRFAGLCWDNEWLRVSALADGSKVERVVGDPEWDAAARHHLEVRALYEDAEMLKRDSDATIKRLMGDRTAVEGGGIRVLYKPLAGAVFADGNKMATAALALAHDVEAREDLDRAAIAAELVRISKLTRQNAGSRPLRIYPSKT